jgi:hypothetical protein
MPPRRSDQLQAAAAPERRSDPFAALTHALSLALFALLPVDQRMRCAEVCRGWCAVLSDASLWLRLDLSPAGGVARASNALLRAAAARAAGGLQALDLTDCSFISLDAVRAVAAVNSSALVEMCILRIAVPRGDEEMFLSIQQFEQLRQAAPQLRVLEADVSCGADEACRVLRYEAPFELLRVRTLAVHSWGDADDVRFLTEEVPSHTWLTGLLLSGAPLRLPAAFDATVDAALQSRLTFLDLWCCGLTPASVPSMARLLGGSALHTLVVEGDPWPLLDEPAALLLGNALRANTTLTSATFKFINLFLEPAIAAVLLGALTAHPSLRKLDVSFNGRLTVAAPVMAAAGAALGALVAANAPALHELRINDCELGDEGLGPLADALPHNTHLHRARAASEVASPH